METPSDPIHIRVLVLDDLGIRVAGKIDSALKQLEAEEETETSWTFSFGHLGQVSLECEFIDDPDQAQALLQKVRKAGPDSEYDIVLVDNDWTEISGGYTTTHGLKMIESIGFPRSFVGPLIAMYTTSPDFEASFVAQALEAGAQFFVDKSEHVHLLNLIFWAIDRQRLRQKEVQTPDQKKELQPSDQIAKGKASSFHPLTNSIISVQGTIRSARFALKGKQYDEATRKIEAAEADATQLLHLREATVKIFKIDRDGLDPMVPSQKGSGADLRALVSSLVKESIRITVEYKKRSDWDSARECPIDNDSSWTAVKALKYDETYLRLTLSEALTNCVKHGTGQDGTVLNAGVEALKDKSYLIFHVINQLPKKEPGADLRLERDIRERQDDKLGLNQMTKAARAWTFPPPELTVDLKKRRFIAKIYIAMKC